MVLECLNRNRAGVRENPRLSCRSYTVEPLAVGKVLRDASNVQISFIPMETFFHLSIDSTHKVYGTGQIFGWRKFLEISSYKILRFFSSHSRVSSFLHDITRFERYSNLYILTESWFCLRKFSRLLINSG